MLGYLRDGDKIRIDLKKRYAGVQISAEEIERRKAETEAYVKRTPASQTPWQQIYRKEVGELSEGMVLNGAVQFQRIAQTMGIPRRNH